MIADATIEINLKALMGPVDVPADAVPDDEMRSRVARGATFLDSARPGWANRINISDLFMYVCERCILGQLFGDYDRGVEVLKVVPHADGGGTGWEAEHWAIARGFHCGDGTWWDLRRLWVAEIRSRRGDA